LLATTDIYKNTLHVILLFRIRNKFPHNFLNERPLYYLINGIAFVLQTIIESIQELGYAPLPSNTLSCPITCK